LTYISAAERIGVAFGADYAKVVEDVVQGGIETLPKISIA